MNGQDTRYKKQTIINSTIDLNSKQKHIYDLEERTAIYAKAIIKICQKIQRNLINNRIIDQLIRSSGSVGANYREANDALGRKDFILRMKITRKEAKESQYWLDLMIEANPDHSQQIGILKQESKELVCIFSSIIIKTEKKGLSDKV